MRGQVVVREVIAASSILWTPDPNEREVKTHRGVVLGMGAPALTKHGHEAPHGFKVGDHVQFHFVHLRENSRNEWVDGKDAFWLPQIAIDGVIEEASDGRA